MISPPPPRDQRLGLVQLDRLVWKLDHDILALWRQVHHEFKQDHANRRDCTEDLVMRLSHFQSHELARAAWIIRNWSCCAQLLGLEGAELGSWHLALYLTQELRRRAVAYWYSPVDDHDIERRVLHAMLKQNQAKELTHLVKFREGAVWIKQIKSWDIRLVCGATEQNYEHLCLLILRGTDHDTLMQKFAQDPVQHLDRILGFQIGKPKQIKRARIERIIRRADQILNQETGVPG